MEKERIEKRIVDLENTREGKWVGEDYRNRLLAQIILLKDILEAMYDPL